MRSILDVEGCASDQRRRYTASGAIAFFGLLGLLPGLYLCGRRRSA